MTSKLVKKNQLRKGSKIYIVPSGGRPLPNMVMILPLECDRKNPEFRDFFLFSFGVFRIEHPVSYFHLMLNICKCFMVKTWILGINTTIGEYTKHPCFCLWY